MEPALSKSRWLFSQETVQKAIQSDLSYSECREFDAIFQTNYCRNFFSNVPGLRRLNPNLQQIAGKLLVDSVPITFSLISLLSGRSLHASATNMTPALPDLIQEIMNDYYLTIDGKVYSTTVINHLIPTNPPDQKIVKLIRERAIDSNGRTYFLDVNYGAPSTQIPAVLNLSGFQDSKLPVENFLLTSSGYLTHTLPLYLRKNGAFGPISVPGAIKVLYDENSGVIAFLKEDKSVVFYLHAHLQPGYNSLIQPIAVDSTKNVADIGFIKSRLVGLTSSGQLINWNDNFQQQAYPVPSRLGRIIRLGDGLVVNEYGFLYQPVAEANGLLWLIVSHSYEVAQITNNMAARNSIISTAGKPLATPKKLIEEVDTTLITTDLYGNELVTYQYEGTQKAWIGPKERNYGPVNITGQTNVPQYSPHNETAFWLKGAIRKGILYDPGVLNPSDPEINQVYLVLPTGSVRIVLVRVRDEQILPID